MKKKRNLIRKNSGFLVGCVIAAGASVFAADVVMTDVLPDFFQQESPAETEGITEAVLEAETESERTYETNAFTITASGSVINGVETEAQTETEADQESADGQTESSGDGSSSDGSGSWDGSSSSGSGSWDGSSGSGGSGQNIEIYDPGNGDYTYTDDGSSGGGSSSGDSSAYTPDDVIIQGISSRYISESELYNYNLGQLRLIRNEIFALNGRIFRSQDLADYFSQKSWYVPTYDPDDFDANMYYYLNDFEEANLQVILNYEAALAAVSSN